VPPAEPLALGQVGDLLYAELVADGATRRLTMAESAEFANVLISAGTETVARLLGWAAAPSPATSTVRGRVDVPVVAA
jgi:hypothetical protein